MQRREPFHFLNTVLIQSHLCMCVQCACVLSARAFLFMSFFQFGCESTLPFSIRKHISYIWLLDSLVRGLVCTCQVNTCDSPHLSNSITLWSDEILALDDACFLYLFYIIYVHYPTSHFCSLCLLKSRDGSTMSVLVPSPARGTTSKQTPSWWPSTPSRLVRLMKCGW